MRKTGDNSLKEKLIETGKKNKLLRRLVYPALAAVIIIEHMARLLKGNARRLTALAMTFLTVFVYGSFSLPVQNPLENKILREQRVITISGGDASQVTADSSGQNGEPGENTDDGFSNGDISQANQVETAGDKGGSEEFNSGEDGEIEDIISGEATSGETVLPNYGEETKDLQGVDQFDLEDILEAGSQMKGHSSTQDFADEEFDGTFSRDDWRLVLINKQHPIPEDYTFKLGTIKGNMRCDERILADLAKMMKAAREDGINLVICSPYRDMERQVMLFERKIKRYMNQGMSYMEAYKEASQTVTVPGSSEHQVGLALDIVSSGYSALDEGFGDTEAGKWLAENGADYGFILRYPKGKEYITGISYEPWHFRYVGRPAAAVIMDKGITLEEFWEDL